MDSSSIVSYINLGLTGLFVAILIGLVIAALIGFKKGIFKSSFILLWMVTLICVLIFCLNPLLKVVEQIPLTFMLPFKAVSMTRTDISPELTFIVPITNIHDTLSSFIEGIYMLYNIGGTSSAAQAFAMALSSTILKYILFLILMIVIVIVGNIFGEILWDAAFKHLIPKVFRKVFKGRIGGSIVYAINYLLVTVMFLSPLTALTNTINQSYQRNKTDDAKVSEIGTFLDAYNSSVFANVFFNWTTNKNGLTFDAALLDNVTSATVDGATISFIDEIKNFSDVAVTFFNGLSGIGTESMVIDYSVLLSTDSINAVFNALGNSNLVTLLLPVAAQIAVNSSLIEANIDLSMLKVSDIDWKNEIGYMNKMVTSIVETGVFEGLLDEEGKLVSIGNTEIINTVKRIFSDSKEGEKNSPFESMLSVFQSAEKSKLFNRAISSVLGFALQSDTEGTISQYINLGWDEINDISWGYESYVLLDSIHTLYAIDDQFVDAIFATSKEDEEETETTEPQLLKAVEEEEEQETIMDLIMKHVSNSEDFAQIKKAFIGDVKDSSTYDKNGRSKVLENGKRIEGRSFCLFDMGIFRSIIIPLLTSLPEQEGIRESIDMADEDLQYFKDTIEELNSGTWVLNYKNEFGNLFDIIGVAAESESLTNAIKNNFEGFIKDNNPFTIEQESISTLQKILKKIDSSKLLYSFAGSFIQGWLNKPENAESFASMGVDIGVLAAGIRQDMKKENHELFHEVADLLDCWDDFGKIYQIITDSEGNADEIVKGFKDPAICDGLAKVINKIVDLKFFNPDPQPGDAFEKNENLYAILEYVFGQLDSLGFTITREDLKKVESNGHLWTNKYDASGNPVVNAGDGKYGEIYYVVQILKFIAEKDFVEALKLDMKSTSVLRKFANSGEGNFDLPGLLAKIDDSKLFANVAGGFIDSAIASTGLLESNTEAIKLSFDNVESWKEEGVKLGRLLNSLADLLDQYGDDFLSSFDISKVDNIPLLNNVLHQLASSDIFKQRNENGTYEYVFGKWLYTKIKSALTSFSLDGNKDLVKDPDNWNLDWGYRPNDGATSDKYFAEYYNSFATEQELSGVGNTYYLVYRDFVSIGGTDSLNGMTAWCDIDTFNTLSSSFTLDSSWKTDNTYNAIFGSDAFMSAYNDIFETDEIGKLCRTLSYVLRLTNMASFSLENLPGSLITNLLDSMNETSCLQMAIYNFYDIAVSMFKNNETATSFIDLSTADIDYLVSTGLKYDELTQIKENRRVEISHLSALLDTFQDINNSGVVSSGNMDITSLNGSLLDSIKTVLKELNRSFVFHRNGTDGSKNTVFQSVLSKIISNDLVISYLYLNDSPKDIALKDEYSAFSSKAWAEMSNAEKGQAKSSYVLKNAFETLKEMSSLSESEKTSNFISQEAEIDTIIECFESILGLNGHIGLVGAGGSLSDVNISTISSDAVSDVLTCLNNSEVLYDLVPNFLHKTFSTFTANSAIAGVNFGDISCFYHYNYNGTVTTDYTNRYEIETIANIASIIDDYQELNSTLGSGELTNKSTLNALLDNGVLANLLEDIHDSYPMHVYSEYNVDGEAHLTVFEQIIKEVMDKTTLTEKAYDSSRDIGLTKDSKIAAQIKTISKLERDNDTNPENYFNNWSKTNGETKAILDLFRTIVDTVDGASVAVTGIDVSSIAPTAVKNILASINKVDIISDAVPSFIKSAFESMNLINLTKLDSTSYACFNINKKLMGGVSGTADISSEIGLLSGALENLYDSEKVGNKYANLSNINDLCNAIANLDGIMNYISNSYILNTNLSTKVFNSMNSVNGCEVSGRGVIMYNLLGGSSDSDFSRYVTGSNKYEKAHSMSKIFTLSNYDYVTESRGLYEVIKKATELDSSSTFDPNDYSKVKAKGEVITGLMEKAYNAYNSKRSYLVSEILSNVLDEAIASERSRITSLGLTYSNASFRFGASSHLTLASNSYDNLNATEKNGLQGVFDLLDVVTRIAALDTSVTKNDITNAFSKMENSELARTYYLSRAHKRASSSEPLVLDFTQEDAIVYVYGSKWSGYTSDVYNPSFSFTNYGNSLAAYLGIA